MFLSQNTLAAHPEARHALLQPSPQRLQLESRPSEPWTLAKTPPRFACTKQPQPLKLLRLLPLDLSSHKGWVGWHNSVETGWYVLLPCQKSTPLVDSNHESNQPNPPKFPKLRKMCTSTGLHLCKASSISSSSNEALHLCSHSGSTKLGIPIRKLPASALASQDKPHQLPHHLVPRRWPWQRFAARSRNPAEPKSNALHVRLSKPRTKSSGFFHSESVQAKRRSDASLVQLPKWHEPDKSWGRLAPGARVPKFQQQLESPNKTHTESQL